MSIKGRKILCSIVLSVFAVLTGCGRNMADSDKAQEKESPLYSFEFRIEDTYALTIGGVVVTGYVQSGTMHAGDSAWLFKEDGTILETSVKALEIYDKEKEAAIMTEEVKEGIPAGVLLEGLEKEQVDIGDVLSGQEK